MSTKRVSNNSRRGGDRDREGRDGKGNMRLRRKPKVAASVGVFDLNDFKNIEILRRFLSETGKILPRRRSGLNAQNQRKLARTIKRARMMGLLPFSDKLVRR